MRCKTYLIYSPFLDQAITIVTFLRRYHLGIEIFGVTLGNEYGVGLRGVYHQIVPVSWVNSVKTNITHIPTGAESTRLLLQKGDITLGSVTLAQSALRVYDKVWLINFASDAGIPTPLTWRTLDEVTSYPLFYKQSQEKGGGARGIAKDESDVPLVGRENLIFQEFIATSGTYGVCFLAEHGRLLTSYVHYERESFPKEGGSAITIEEFSDRRLLDYTQRLLQSLDYSGWGLAEYKYCPRREDFVFMEVNAKFWASCEFAFRNHPMFLKLLFEIDSKEKPVKRMVFIERSLARGIPFFMGHLPTYFNGSMLKVYPGWPIRIVRSFLPPIVRRGLKYLRAWLH